MKPVGMGIIIFKNMMRRNTIIINMETDAILINLTGSGGLLN